MTEPSFSILDWAIGGHLSDLGETGSVDWNITDSDGRTALHLSALHGNLNIFMLLWNTEHVDRHAKDNEGMTACMLAARSD